MVISTGQLTKMQERKEAASTDIEQASVQSLLQYRVLFRVVTLFHHITVVVILTSLNISQTDIHFLITVKKYSSRFITHWNFVIQIIYLVLTLLCDFLEWMRWDNGTVARKLTRVKDFCFSTLVFPNALFVTSTFWGLYALDRELISPKQMELTVPFWINHSTHTVILMVVLLDLVLQPGERPLNDSKNKITIYSFVLVYQIVLLCTYLEAGYWIYPLYNLFNVSQYFMFSVYNFFAYGVGYELQWPLFVTSTFWGLYALDRELISPKQMELTVPFWINHSTHTVILMVVLLDLVLQPGERPLNDSKNKITIYSFVLVYQIVLLCTYLEAGYWIYPLYNLFNVSQYFMFSVYNFFAYGVGYELQWPLISWTRKLREIKTLKML